MLFFTAELVYSIKILCITLPLFLIGICTGFASVSKLELKGKRSLSIITVLFGLISLVWILNVHIEYLDQYPEPHSSSENFSQSVTGLYILSIFIIIIGISGLIKYNKTIKAKTKKVEEPTDKLVICPKCGRELKTDSVFCDICSYKLK